MMLAVLAADFADAEYGWAYVIAGWTITALVLVAYFAWLVARTRRAQRSLPPESDR
jgi:hypothetical protein